MHTFLFTAVNRAGKSVTERVEAENLAQGRDKLELQGYSEITFYENEFSKETDKLFDEKKLKNAQKQHLENQVSVTYDTSIARHFLNMLKATWAFWAIIVGAVVIFPNPITLSLLAFVAAFSLYISFPVIIFNRLYAAHGWNKNSRVRLWSMIAKSFNYVAYCKIPPSEIDAYLSCMNAREGDLESALRRVSKYQSDPNISKRMYNSMLVRIYANARNFEMVLQLHESSINEGGVYHEELLDYALCLARRHGQTARARSVLEQLYESELSAMTGLFVPYCQGVIEIEDGDYARAEFYLRQASKQLEPFRKNAYLIGLKSEVKAFLALAVSQRGETAEAEQLFADARPYLAAIDEHDLLERCEAVLN